MTTTAPVDLFKRSIFLAASIFFSPIVAGAATISGLTASANPSPATAGQSVTFSASAFSPAGIRKLEFYDDNTILLLCNSGTSGSCSYTYASAGSYSVRALAEDNDGDWTTYSFPLTVNPAGGGGGGSTQMAAPSKPSGYSNAPGTVQLSWSNTPNTFWTVDIDREYNGAPNGVVYSPFYSDNTIPGGAHTFIIKAHDSLGIKTESAAVTSDPITVLGTSGGPGTPLTIDRAAGAPMEGYYATAQTIDFVINGDAGTYFMQCLNNGTQFESHTVTIDDAAIAQIRSCTVTSGNYQLKAKVTNNQDLSKSAETPRSYSYQVGGLQVSISPAPPYDGKWVNAARVGLGGNFTYTVQNPTNGNIAQYTWSLGSEVSACGTSYAGETVSNQATLFASTLKGLIEGGNFEGKRILNLCVAPFPSEAGAVQQHYQFLFDNKAPDIISATPAPLANNQAYGSNTKISVRYQDNLGGDADSASGVDTAPGAGLFYHWFKTGETPTEAATSDNGVLVNGALQADAPDFSGAATLGVKIVDRAGNVAFQTFPNYNFDRSAPEFCYWVYDYQQPTSDHQKCGGCPDDPNACNGFTFDQAVTIAVAGRDLESQMQSLTVTMQQTSPISKTIGAVGTIQNNGPTMLFYRYDLADPGTYGVSSTAQNKANISATDTQTINLTHKLKLEKPGAVSAVNDPAFNVGRFKVRVPKTTGSPAPLAVKIFYTTEDEGDKTLTLLLSDTQNVADVSGAYEVTVNNVKANRKFTNLFAAYGLDAQTPTMTGESDKSDPSPDQAWTRPAAPAVPTGAKIVGTTLSGPITINSNNFSGQPTPTGYRLEAKRTSPNPETTFSKQSNVVTATTPSVSFAVDGGASYSVRVTAISRFVDSEQWNTSSTPELPAAGKFNKPTVSGDSADSTPTTLSIKVTASGSERPACAVVTAGSLSGTAQFPAGSGTVTVPVNSATPNTRYAASSIKAKVGSTTDCSSDPAISDDGIATADVWSRPSKPGAPTQTTPYSANAITMQWTAGSPANAAGTTYKYKAGSTEGSGTGTTGTVSPLSSGQALALSVCAVSGTNNAALNECTDGGQGFTKFSAPTQLQLLNTAADTDAGSFKLRIFKSASEQPVCAQISFSPQPGGQPVIVSVGAGGSSDVQVTPLNPNTSYSSFSAKLGKDCSAADQLMSGQSPTLAGPGWTKPAAPSSAPSFVSATANSITATCPTNGSNPSGTQYELWAAPATNGTADWTKKTVQACSGSQATVSPLAVGSDYIMKVHVLSSKTPRDTSLDVESPESDAMSTAFAAPGTVRAKNDPAVSSEHVFGVIIPVGQNTNASFAELSFTGQGGTEYRVSLDLKDCALATGEFTCPVNVLSAQSAANAPPTVYSNVGYKNLKARFRRSPGGVNYADTTAPFSTVSAAQVAWTKPETVPLTGVTLPTPTGNVTASFTFVPNNGANSAHFLQYKAEDAPGVVDWTTGVSQSPANLANAPLQGTGNSSIDATLEAGLQYQVRLCVQNLAGLSATDWNACSDALPPGVIPAKKPTVSVNFPLMKGTSFNITVAAGGDNPEVAKATYTSTINPSVSGQSREISFSGDTSISFDVSNASLIGNSSYTVTAQTRLTSPKSWSPYATPVIAWTAPIAPSAPYRTASPDRTSIGVEIDTPTNSPQTRYQVQAVADNPNNFSNKNNIQFTPTFNAEGPIPRLTGLTPGKLYFIRIYVFSDYQSPAHDTYTWVSDGILTETPPATGHIVNVTSNSITAYWDQVNTSGLTSADFLIAGATDFNNTQYLSDKVSLPLTIPGTTPNITLGNLQVSNTSYTVFLEKLSETFSVPYERSQRVATLDAATPAKPTGDIDPGSTRTNVVMTLALTADNNSPDSLYAIEVTSNTPPAKYLNGTGGLSSTPVFKTLSQWQAGTTASLSNAGLANTFRVRLVVQQKRTATAAEPLNGAKSSAIETVTTPGATVDVTYDQLSGKEMDGFIFGVPANGPFNARFTTRMNGNSFTGKVHLTRLEDNADIPVDPTLSSDAKTLVITPRNELKAGKQYRVNIEAGLQDMLGIPTEIPFTKTFIAGVNGGEESTLYSPLDDQRTSAVVVGKGALSPTTIIIPRTRSGDAASPYPLTAPAASVDRALGGNKAVREHHRVEVLFYNMVSGAPAQGDAPAAVTLRMSLGNGERAGAAIDPGSLQIYYAEVVNGAVQLKPLKTSISNGVASATINKNGVYVLAGTVSTNLSNAFAYPVPFKPSEGHTRIFFKNLAADTTIKVFTITGELVKEIKADGTVDPVEWNVQNEDGDRVASGVYVYQIKNSYSEKRGKLMVIR